MATSTQQSAQDYINKQGGTAAYIATQQAKLATATAMNDSTMLANLAKDAARTGLNYGTTAQATVSKPLIGPTLTGDRPNVHVPVSQPTTTPVKSDPNNGTLQGPYLNPNGGYQQGLPIVNGVPQYGNGQQPQVNTNPGYNLDDITRTATSTVNNKIAAQIAAYNQQVAAGQQANNLAETQNTNYLTNALKSSGDQHTIDNSNAHTIQNRRGGFYSGGLDFQLGGQDKAYATAEGNLRQDVQTRNNDIYAKNAQLANQAAENIKLLQSQAPDMIRQAIQDEIDRQRGINIQEAGLTGQYGGNDTMAQKQNNISNNIAVAGLTGNYTPPQTTALQLEMQTNSAKHASASPAEQARLHARNEVIGKQLGMTYDSQKGTWSGGTGSVRTIAGQNADLNREQTMATLTGYMSDGKGGYVPTSAKQQQNLTNAWSETEQLGFVTPALSKLTGIKAGTPTQQAKNQAQQIAISQQNANTSSNNSAASINNMNADNTRADNAVKLTQTQHELAGTIAGELAQATSKQDVLDFFNNPQNATEMAKNLTQDQISKMKAGALAPYDAVSASQKVDLTIREKAIASAQKEFAWKTATQAQREAMIKEHEAYFN